jgi:hypothetical protein
MLCYIRSILSHDAGIRSGMTKTLIYIIIILLVSSDSINRIKACGSPCGNKSCNNTNDP